MAEPRFIVSGNNCFTSDGEHFSELDERMLEPFIPGPPTDVVIACLPTPTTRTRDRLISRGAEVVMLVKRRRFAHGAGRALATPLLLWRMCRLLGTPSSVAYARLPSPTGFLMLLASWLTGAKLICSLHGAPRHVQRASRGCKPISSFLSGVTAKLIRRADLVLTTSDHLLAVYGANPSVGHRYTSTLLEKVPDLTNRDVSRQPVRLIAVGRMTPEKNFVHVILVAASMIAHGTETEVVLIGDGQEHESLTQAAHAHGVPVQMKGWINDHAALLSEVENAHFLLLPSLAEGSPKVLLEAMSQGAVVCTWPINSAVASLATEETAIVLEGPRDPEAWAKRLLSVDAKKYNELRRNANALAREHTIPALRHSIQECLAEHLFVDAS